MSRLKTCVAPSPSARVLSFFGAEARSGRVDSAMMLLAAMPGMLLALWLYGPALDPRHVAWLLSEGDSLQHFSGWDMFRRDAWRWPLGALPTLGSELGASIVYTDSIPLVAIPLKLLHGWLPDPLQYIGPVMLFNLALNGAVTAGLLRWCGGGRWLALLGSMLVTSLPMVTMRGPGALGHEALSSHWLILLALWLSLVPDGWKQAMCWLGLLMAAVLVHFYLFFMVGVLWSAWWVAAMWRAWPRWGERLSTLMIVPTTVLVVLGVMYAAGYFEFAMAVGGDTGFGLYSTGLLSFLDPGSAALFFEGEAFQGASRLWDGWRSPVAGQYEGFAYAGLGVLLLLAAALGMMLRRREIPLTVAERWLLVPLVLLFCFALGDRLVIGTWVVSLPYPDIMEPLTQRLRSAGRMAWPLLYGLLMAALLVLARRLPARGLRVVLVVALVAQAWDISVWQEYVKERMARLAPGEDVVRPFAWRRSPDVVAMLEDSREIRLLPGDDWHQVKIVSWLAARHDLVSNVAYYARTNPGVLYAAAADQRRALEAGQVAPGVLYALTAPGLAAKTCKREDVKCLEVKGMTLAEKRRPR